MNWNVFKVENGNTDHEDIFNKHNFSKKIIKTIHHNN